MENNLQVAEIKQAASTAAIFTFLRAQVSAFTGGVCDYLIMVFLTEAFGVYYTASIIISGILGAVVNYSINRYWAFNATRSTKRTQLSKFVLVVMGSIAIKDAGTFLFTELLHLDYKISKLVVDAITSLGFNYVLQKYWVFKK